MRQSLRARSEASNSNLLLSAKMMMNVPRPSALVWLIALAACPELVTSYNINDGKKFGTGSTTTSRRGWTQAASAGIVAAAVAATNVIADPAHAAGPDKARATDKCRDGARNCIRTTWVPPAGKSKSDAITDIRSAVQSYPEKGQHGVDCNGWVFVDDNLDIDGMARIEYYSCIGPAAISMNLAKPFIDDVKLDLVEDGNGKFRFELRSKSRVGASDMVSTRKGSIILHKHCEVRDGMRRK